MKITINIDIDIFNYILQIIAETYTFIGALLLTWINLSPSMDKWWHQFYGVRWMVALLKYLS